MCRVTGWATRSVREVIVFWGVRMHVCVTYYEELMTFMFSAFFAFGDGGDVVRIFVFLCIAIIIDRFLNARCTDIISVTVPHAPSPLACSSILPCLPSIAPP